ncbi:MAG: Fe-S-containing hydro-lyase [Heliobacteriaceae bacterium]|nr:Fe-S-containing hydro-lyase [Heliobacteriaceae bacterium]MDD4587421.1 Fe-S-containing hydro-lyase [Heliobacteriaceae bacterium]
MHGVQITTPFTQEAVRSLKAGQMVSISGVIYTGRDAAHKRLVDTLDRGEALPFEPKETIMYYVGPCPAKPGKVIGPAGPTTSYRMDPYAPRMIAAGQTGMIGKGLRSKEVVDAMKQYGAVYFAAIGGAGALMAQSIKQAKVIAYDDLGTEAVRELVVENLPAIVVIDAEGNNLYETGKAAYKR